MTKTEKQAFEVPDFDKFAGGYDRFLYLVEPVNEMIFARMPSDLDGSKILDVACGTGEPGLSLAGRNPAIRVLGIDAAVSMIDIAARKSVDSAAQNVNFQVMSAEKMTFPDQEFDGVISRFGLGMFGDTQLAAREAFRVLKEEGFFVVAVWHDLAQNTFLRIMREAANELVSIEEPGVGVLPGFDAEMQFKAAGFDSIKCSELTWSYLFRANDDLRAMVAIAGAHILRAQFGAIHDQSRTDELYSLIVERFAQYKNDDGVFQIPHTCLLLEGKKPASA